MCNTLRPSTEAPKPPLSKERVAVVGSYVSEALLQFKALIVQRWGRKLTAQQINPWGELQIPPSHKDKVSALSDAQVTLR